MSDTQTLVKEALTYADVTVPDGATVILDDAGSGLVGSFYRISYGQLEGAADQYRQVTGDDLGDLSAIEAELGWY